MIFRGYFLRVSYDVVLSRICTGQRGYVFIRDHVQSVFSISFPLMQSKLVCCVKEFLFEVVVEIRKEVQCMFGMWLLNRARIISADFLSEVAVFEYKYDNFMPHKWIETLVSKMRG